MSPVKLRSGLMPRSLPIRFVLALAPTTSCPVSVIASSGRLNTSMVEVSVLLSRAGPYSVSPSLTLKVTVRCAVLGSPEVLR